MVSTCLLSQVQIRFRSDEHAWDVVQIVFLLYAPLLVSIYAVSARGTYS